MRVTEQDVVNEEMYEEEDDDIPAQYRRLTAHLQTGSPDFNRRLAAYLTNTVAMRTALEDAVNSSFNKAFPNAPQYAHNQINQNNLPPFLRRSEVEQSMRAFDSPRSSPYPMTGPMGPRANQIKSASILTVGSEPVHEDSGSKSAARRSSGSDVDRDPQPGIASRFDKRHGSTSTSSPHPSMPSPAMTFGASPLSIELPLEAQQLLAAMPLKDSYSPGSKQPSIASGSIEYPYVSYGNSVFPRTKGIYPMYSGMNATLAPSALDTSLAQGYVDNSAPIAYSAPPEASAFSFSGGGLFTPPMSRDESRFSELDSAQHDRAFEDFINGESWE